MPDSYGQVKAIGGNKYTVAINAQVNQVDFEVEKPCAGLLMRIQEIDNIYMRVHYEDAGGKRNSLISEISLKDYLCLTQRLSQRVQVIQVDVQTDEVAGDPPVPVVEQWYQFLLLLSMNGDLHLNDENKLIVQLFQKDIGEDFEEVKAYFEYYCFGEIGYPIVLEKQRILQSNDFANIDALGFDYVYIPEGTNFEYIQYEKGAYQGARKTTYDQAHYDASLYDLKNDISFGAKGLVIDTRVKTEFDLSHLNDKDIHIYKLDCVRESVKMASIQKRNEEALKLQNQASELSGQSVKSNAVKQLTSGSSIKQNTLNNSAGVTWTPPFNPSPAQALFPSSVKSSSLKGSRLVVNSVKM